MFKIKNIIGNKNYVAEYKTDLFTILRKQKETKLVDAKMEDLYKGLTDRQIVCALKDTSAVLRKDAFLWSVGDVVQSKGKDGHPEYAGNGYVMSTEFRDNLIILDQRDYYDQLAVFDKNFVACDGAIKQTLMTVDGGEPYLLLQGKGNVIIHNATEESELATILIEKDCIRLKSGRAVAWDASLKYTTETFGGEKVDVFTGNGKVLFA